MVCFVVFWGFGLWGFRGLWVLGRLGFSRVSKRLGLWGVEGLGFSGFRVLIRV